MTPTEASPRLELLDGQRVGDVVQAGARPTARAPPPRAATARPAFCTASAGIAVLFVQLPARWAAARRAVNSARRRCVTALQFGQLEVHRVPVVVSMPRWRRGRSLHEARHPFAAGRPTRSRSAKAPALERAVRRRASSSAAAVDGTPCARRIASGPSLRPSAPASPGREPGSSASDTTSRTRPIALPSRRRSCPR